jgi:tryptophanase
MQKMGERFKSSGNLFKKDVKFEKIRNEIFRPKIKYYELEYYFSSREVKLKNKSIYEIVRNLTSLAFPDSFRMSLIKDGLAKIFCSF